jgi:sugar phosphate isomerase/epimerase
LTALQPQVGHVHLKGYADGSFCGFGEGDVDLLPALRALIAGGYGGDFTVEYEGAGDRTLRLYESVRRARAVVSTLLAPVR